MISSDLDNYDVVPIFEDDSEYQVICVRDKEKDQELGKIKIIEENDIYHLRVNRDDLDNEVQMGVVKQKKNIGVELAIVVKKLSRC